MGEIKSSNNKTSETKEAERSPSKEMPRQIPRQKKKKVGKSIFFSILLLAAIAFGGFYFYKYQQVNEKYTDLTMSEEDKSKKLVSEVSKLYTVPKYEEEKPTVYIVKNKDQLANNQFFKDAEIEDTMLAYQKSDLAILYRPSSKKIIKVDSFAKMNAKIAQIAIIGPADKQEAIEKTLKSSYSNISVISKSTTKNSVSQGVVVDITGKEPDATSKLASLLGLQVGSLPEGETVPSEATMVIVLPSQ